MAAEMDLMTYLSKVDFTKGFQSFHIVWKVGKVQLKSSQDFDTTVIDGEKTATIRWNLGISTSENNDHWIGITSRNDMVVPVVYRYELLRAGREPEFQKIFFKVFHPPTENSWGGAYTADEFSRLTADDYVIHCWIDIPKGILLLDRGIKIVDKDESKIPAQLTTFQRHMAKLFGGVLNDDHTSDVTLLILKKNEKGTQAAKSPKLEEVIRRFYCHVGILTTRCAVFASMFSGNWKESKGGEIEIKEIDPNALEAMLRYIYTSEFPNESSGVDHLSNVIYAADEYCLDELKDHCVILLMRKDITDQRMIHLRVADRHNLGQLKAICVSQLSMDMEEISTAENINIIGPKLFAEINQARFKRDRFATVINLAWRKISSGR